ncbi:MAG: hypothetical protein DSY80_00100 [Desulfocapsa sp.]|nr:MAG: hypothetical protein DSY80_00100 [Desulfocapsa sp.]
MFARFKLQTDPMFADLPGLLAEEQNRIRSILDIGCGYGVPGCWCLELCNKAKLVGIDPDAERVRVAALAMGERAEVIVSGDSQLPHLPEPVDLVLLLDMLHYLDDESVKKLFANSYGAMAENGLLLIRYVIVPENREVSRAWKLENWRTGIRGGKACYRTQERMAALLADGGFQVEVNQVTSRNEELVWLSGRVVKK